ncbi:MAG: hypothetical protein OXI97_17250 [Acidimicrobiaceae bacterium]|nr:hypothetical protein [Acidimicrobiaceae bacterium]
MLRGWIGDGDLLRAVAASQADDHSWSERDIRQRGQRIALGRLSDDLQRLPQSEREWAAALPTASYATKAVAVAPSGGVRWAETVRFHGWPPAAYVRRHRRRMTDETALTALAWLSLRLDAYRHACHSSPALLERIGAPIAAMRRALAHLDDPSPVRPDRTDLRSLRSSGQPWPVVSQIAELITRVDEDPAFIAFELLSPEPDLVARLFHLNIFGEVLRALRQGGFRCIWLSPIGGARSGPRLQCVDRYGLVVDLWFEAAGSRKHYALGDGAYVRATRSISGAGGPIGADIALVSRARNAVLLLECKWSPDSSYIARDGFHQAASYALEARDGLGDKVWSFIVGPAEIIPEPSLATQLEPESSIVLGSVSCDHVPSLVDAFRSLSTQALTP